MDKTTFKPISSKPIIPSSYKKFNQQQPIQRSFNEHLSSAITSKESLNISKHAKERLQQRNINISSERWEKINEKVQEAGKLGVKDSLVLLKDAALIVSAKNRMVITAMGREEATTQIFTNINGTILLED